MRATGAQGREDQRGQASVELLGALPAALLVVAIGWQLLLAGQTTWLAANAARVAARAKAVGKDPEAAARSSLPSYLRDELLVADDNGAGRVRVRVRVPLVLRSVPSPVSVGADAAMEPQEGTRP
jgi:pilus assembly protein CpaE